MHESIRSALLLPPPPSTLALRLCLCLRWRACSHPITHEKVPNSQRIYAPHLNPARKGIGHQKTPPAPLHSVYISSPLKFRYVSKNGGSLYTCVPHFPSVELATVGWCGAELLSAAALAAAAAGSTPVPGFGALHLRMLQNDLVEKLRLPQMHFHGSLGSANRDAPQVRMLHLSRKEKFLLPQEVQNQSSSSF
mmetsp:Transcript_4359/g.6420  ORF Transcript_4359/g.6420 Transcript_4359/m.6420 type:complete len:193 (-) Transcript_4359:437-1015(-)